MSEEDPVIVAFRRMDKAHWDIVRLAIIWAAEGDLPTDDLGLGLRKAVKRYEREVKRFKNTD